MIKKLNLKDTKIAKCVLELQIASYEVEADIIGFHDIPPLKETIDSLKNCDEIFYGYHTNNDLAGIISFKIIDNVLDIHRVAVHPVYFRMGIASKLISFVEGLTNGLDKVTVCTGKENLPAINLYFKKGYRKVGNIEISNDVYLTEFEKIL